MGIVQTIYRGAKLKDVKNGAKNPRKMRVCKPSGAPLPATCTSRIRMLLLTNVEGNRYFSCCLSPVIMLDPCCQVVAEAPVETVHVAETKIIMMFTEKVMNAIAKIKEKPELLNVQDATGDEKASEASEASDPVADAPLTIYARASFNRLLAGTKNIQSFLRDLPRLWQAAGMSFLDKEQKITVPKSGGKTLLWEEVCLRAPEMFDITMTKETSQKAFGGAVLTRFHAMMPGKPNAKESIYNLVGQIEKLALDCRFCSRAPPTSPASESCRTQFAEMCSRTLHEARGAQKKTVRSV